MIESALRLAKCGIFRTWEGDTCKQCDITFSNVHGEWATQ
ncbi:hypothetical protein FHT17_000763 [Novosphingobium sp. SG916]|nr:hypothetical protein [Novosphingobium sp. SG720]NMN04117.1 hypothetical protein [Novosphingobium sp. SG919]NMN85893.1 hypothetical protein [Novosphingobium sp. SG916]